MIVPSLKSNLHFDSLISDPVCSKYLSTQFPREGRGDFITFKITFTAHQTTKY